jgi:hypothetical protein
MQRSVPETWLELDANEAKNSGDCSAALGILSTI